MAEDRITTYQVTGPDGKKQAVRKSDVEKYGWDGYNKAYPDYSLCMQNEKGDYYNIPLSKVDDALAKGFKPYGQSTVIRKKSQDKPQPQPQSQELTQADNASTDPLFLSSGAQAIFQEPTQWAETMGKVGGTLYQSEQSRKQLGQLFKPALDMERTKIGEQTPDNIGKRYGKAVEKMTFGPDAENTRQQLENDIKNDLVESRREDAKVTVYNPYTGTSGMRSQRTANLEAASAFLDSANKIQQAANSEGGWASDLARGVRDAFQDPATLTLGLSGADQYRSVFRAINKMESGEQLSKDEQTLLDAAAYNMYVAATNNPNLSRSYRVGKGVAESLPFMVEFFVNPISGVGKESARKLAEYTVKKYAGKAIGKYLTGGLAKTAARKAGKFALGAAANVVPASVMAATTSAPRTVGGMYERMVGDIKPEVADDMRTIVYGGHEGEESVGKALAKSYASTTIENWSEFLGDQFEGVLPAVGKLFAGTKLGTKIMNSKIGRMASNAYEGINSTDLARMVKNFEKATHFNGTFNEFAEEVAGNFANAIIVGDQELNTGERGVFNPDNLIDTYLTVAVMGAIPSGLRMTGYAASKLSSDKLRSADRDAANAMGDSWPVMREQILNASNEARADYLKQVVTSPVFSDNDKKAILTYVGEVAKREAAQEFKRMQKEDPAYSAYENKRDIINNYNEVSSAIGEEKKANLDSYSDYWEWSANNRNASGEEKEDAGLYFSAREDMYKYVDEMNARIRNRVDARMQEINNLTNPDTGEVITVQSNYYQQPVNIVGGRLTFDEAGNVDAKASDKIIYYVDNNGKRMMATPDKFNTLVSRASAADMRAQVQQEEETNAWAQEEQDMMQPEIGVEDRVILPDGTAGVVTEVTDEGSIVTLDNGSVVSVDPSQIRLESQVIAEQETAQQNQPEMAGQTVEQPEVSAPQQPAGMTESSAQDQPAEVQHPEPQVQETQEGQPMQTEQTTGQIPEDEKGRYLFTQVPAEQTYAYLYTQDDLTPEEAGMIIDQNIQDAQKQIDKLASKKPKPTGDLKEYRTNKAKWEAEKQQAQADLDYWNQVKAIGEQIKQQQEVEALDSEAKDLMSKTDPMNGEELAAKMLSTGGIKLTRDSYLKETGFKPEEASKMFGMFASPEKGGVSVEKAGEMLELMDREDGYGFFPEGEVNAGRDAILSVLQQAKTRGDLYRFIENRRKEQAQREQDAMRADYENFIMTNTGMTVEEYQTYEDMRTQQMLERSLSEADKNAIIEEFISEEPITQQEDGTAGEQQPISTTSETGGEVLPDEQPLPAGGNGVAETESGEVSGGVVDEDGITPEETATEPVSDIPVEQLSESPESANEAKMEEIAYRLSEIEYRLSELEGESGIFNEAERISLEMEKNELEQEYDGLKRINAESKAIQDAEAEVNQNPTEAQKESGNYKKGHLKIDGYDITIENPKGSERSGKDQNGNQWSVTMNNTYGYIRGTESVDGDHIDVFLSDNPSEGNVFVVDQIDQETGEFDEHKVMYGFNSMEEAKAAYLSNYSEGWKIGTITEVSKDEFKKWINSSKRKTKPFSEYSSVKPIAGENEPVSDNISEDNNKEISLEDINNSPFEEEMKDGARAYLKGIRNFATEVAYNNILNYVRNRARSNESDSQGAGETQLDGETDGAGSAEVGPSGNETDQVDRVGSGENVSESGVRGTDSIYGPSVPDGERSNNEVRGEEPGNDGVSSGRSNTKRSRKPRSNGDNVRSTGRRKSGKQNDGENTKRRNTAKSEQDSALDEIYSLLDDFVKAGNEGLSLSVVGMNSKQIEIAGKILVAGVRLGYTYIKDGIYKFNAWRDAMRGKLSVPFSQAMKLTDPEIDEFIEDMWNYPHTIDGETKLLKEWAAEMEHEELRNQVRMTINEKKKMQEEAESIPVQVGNMQNIVETLPYLLPQQQEDVYKAEIQFFDPSHSDREHGFGKGYLFTNGTGTGKTYTGLGIVKRFIKQGKSRVLILTPSQQKVLDWTKDAKNLGIDLKPLESTKDKGEGAVITTFANLRTNKALMEDAFDLIVYDESHRIMENKNADETIGARQHYMLSNKNEDEAIRRLQSIHPLWIEQNELIKEMGSLDKMMADPDMMQEEYAEKDRRREEIQKRLEEIKELQDKEMPEMTEKAKEAVQKTKTVFLSATPFNTIPSLAYTEGYIFSYPKENQNTIGSYNHRSPRESFLERYFGAGYRFRYGRIESHVENPEALSQQEVQFSDYLENELGTKSGRIIDSEYDYSRDFPTVTVKIAPLFNGALEDVFNYQNNDFSELRDAFRSIFYDYNYSTALFETMKIAAIVPRIKEHLKMGRKVVVFHRRVTSKNPLQPPFRLALEAARDMAGMIDTTSDEGKEKKKKALKQISDFEKKYDKLLIYEQTLNYEMPREQLAEVFGRENVLYFSGKETKKVKDAAVNSFNDDNSGKNIIVIQEASGKEGISLHDTTGNHQRVLITLALPQSPITALQIEGRTYRIGNKSNAIFEYPLLGLNLETTLFGSKFNQQVSTTENLALGSKARNLRTSFAEGVLQHSGDIPLESQGIGGKDFDNEGKQEQDGFDKSVLDYYGTQKLRGKRNERAGIDYYPTPEPIGYKMVEWARLMEGEDVLEPSAGHGAIARYVPRINGLTAIEPSQDLFSLLQLRAGGTGRKFVDDIFENYNLVNKFDVVLMNPPYGSAGRTAIDHVEKAFNHLNEGGRVIAIIPRGSADQKFDKWLEKTPAASFVGEVLLPSVTFSRAGTSVNTRIVIVDKVSRDEAKSKVPTMVSRDLTYIDKIEGPEGLFEALRDIQMPQRTIDRVAIDMKNARKTIRELKDINGVDSVDISEHGIDIDGRYPRFLSLSWEELKDPKKYLFYSQQYDRFANDESKKGREIADFYTAVLKTFQNVSGKTHEEFLESKKERNTTGVAKMSDKYKYVLGTHTVTGADMHLAKPIVEGSLSDEEYSAISKVARKHGGYWNRTKKAFHFDNEEKAQAFLNDSVEVQQVRYRIEEDNNEIENIISSAKANGTYMKAPNGAETKLNERQWLQVRTENFLNWFGDWINNPSDASKVVDENGEPRVVYHQTNSTQLVNVETGENWEDLSWQEKDEWEERDDFDEYWEEQDFYQFDNKSHGRRSIEMPAFFFAPQYDEYHEYGNRTIEAFLNIRKPAINPIIENAGVTNDAGEVAMQKLIDQGYDGFFREYEGEPESNEYNAFFPNQIKSAADNTGEFSSDNPDIRYSISKSTELKPSDKSYTDAVEDISNKVGVPVSVVTGDRITGTDAETKKKAKAWYDPNTKTITINLDKVVSVEDAQRSYLHEVVGHYGLRELFGDQFDDAMFNMYGLLPKNIQEEIQEYMMKNYASQLARLSTAKDAVVLSMEEYLSRKAEENPDASWWDRICGSIRNMFRKIGIGLKLNNNDVRYLLWRSKNNLNKGRNVDFGKPMPQYDQPRFRMEENATINEEELKGESVMKQAEIIATTIELDKSERDNFERRIKNTRIREGWQDRMIAVKRFQEKISEVSGKVIKSWENAYDYENTIASRSQYYIDEFKEKMMKPIYASISKLGDQNKVRDYLKAKHGLERNQKMREREVQKVKDKLEAELKTFIDKWSEKVNSAKDRDKAMSEMQSAVEAVQKRMENRIEKVMKRESKKDYSGLSSLYKRLFNPKESVSMQQIEDKFREFVSTYESDNKENIDDLWKNIRLATNYTLDFLHDTNVLSKEMLEKIKSQYEYYVPLREWQEKKADQEFEYFSDHISDAFTDPLKKAEGRTSESGDPIASILNMAQSSIFIGHKNMMKLHFLRMVRNNRTNLANISSLWYVKNEDGQWEEVAADLDGTETYEEAQEKIASFEEKMKAKKEMGLAKRKRSGLKLGMPIKKWQARQHEIRVKELGQEYIVYVNTDPRIAQAINGLNNINLSARKYAKPVNAIKAFMTTSYTTKNVAFIGSNMFRDFILSLTNSFIKEGASYSVLFLSSIGKSTKELGGYIWQGKVSKDLETFLKNGGETGFVSLLSYEQSMREVEKGVNQYKKTLLAKDFFSVLGKVVERINRHVENIFRYGIFLASRKSGKSVPEAVKDAKEITVNFNRKGSGAYGSAYANMAYFFLNAGVQGLNNTIETASKNKTRALIAYSFWAGLGFMIPTLLCGDDDDDNLYDQIPNFIRRQNICIPNGKNGYITIPLPIEIRVLFSIGDMAYRYQKGKYNGSDTELAADLFGTIMEVMPKDFISGGNYELDYQKAIFFNAMPDVIKPITDTYIVNTTWTGRPIKKETPYNKYVPEYRKVYRGTNEYLVEASKFINSISGGNYAEKGSLDGPLNNPASLEYMIQQYMGGAARTYYQAILSTIRAIDPDKEVATKDIPIVNRFYKSTSNDRPLTNVNERYFEYVEMSKEYDSQKREYSRGIKEGEDLSEDFKEFMKKNRQAISSIISNSNQAIQQLNLVRPYLDDEAQEKLDKQIYSIRKKAVDQIDKLKK